MKRNLPGIVTWLVALSGTLPAEDRNRILVGHSRIDVVFRETPPPAVRKAMLDWIETSARAVEVYHSRFPVKQVEIRVRLGDAAGPSNGITYGWNGALITITAGRSSKVTDFSNDWLMPHEMLHLGFPSVPEKHHWIEEGISTYVEPVARARAGLISEEEAWGDLVRGLPQGQPKAGDQGLDLTHTWGRTYWGGAIFCLLADVEIRKRTGNRFGLEHALRAIVRAGGTIEAEWELVRALKTGDAATGVPVLQELYVEMRDKPAPADLDALWRELGVKHQGRKISFDDSAALAPVRKSITRPEDQAVKR